MKKYKILKKYIDRWNGDGSTGSVYGWGDYCFTKWTEITTIEAIDEKHARQQARKLFKENGWRCCFSRTGINCLLEELK